MRRPPVRLSILVCLAVPLAMLLWASIETTREISVTPAAIDFGEVQASSDMTRRLAFRNPNHGPALVRIAADCNCVILSHSELRVPSQSETTVDVTLSRMTGDRRDRWYTLLESELEVTAYTDEGARSQSIPISATFFEPYAVDRAACQVNGLATELGKQPIPFSAATPEAGRPTVGQVPPFVESVEVDWDDEHSAGELLVTIKRDAPPGLHEGDIEMHLASLSSSFALFAAHPASDAR